MMTSHSSTEWNEWLNPRWRRIDRRILLVTVVVVVITIVGTLVVVGGAYDLSTLPTNTTPQTTVSGIIREITLVGSEFITIGPPYVLWSDTGTVYTIQFAHGYFVDLSQYVNRHVQITGIISAGPAGIQCNKGNTGSTCTEVTPQFITISSPPILV